MATLRTSDLTEKPRPDLVIFYALDTSGSMAGERIQILNTAMDNTIDALKKSRSADSHLKIAVLQYDTTARWVNEVTAEYIEDFIWTNIERPSGLTNVPAALKELDQKMSKNGFLGLSRGDFMPIVIFMTDGMINSQFLSDFALALDRLNNNLWFQGAMKIGFAIGNDADEDMVRKIVGDEGLCKTDDLQSFADMLVKVSVKSALLNGTSHLAHVSGGSVISSARQGEGDGSTSMPEQKPDSSVWTWGNLSDGSGSGGWPAAGQW